ncbi:MAG: PqqD family protein [Pseudomonadota bacterium]
MNLSRATMLERRPGVLAQQVKTDDPSIVLLNPKNGQYYTLEAVGTRVWQLCDGKRTVSEIAAIIGQEYEQSPDVIESDVLELAKELVDEELVVPTS